ncbi:hypothetical protein MTZ49_11045 [Entomomonas sp. E2T0]|uniref:hypothetical protein n=1 Tax=Entomomonas sp. E2T0 TaxID=2930213 RepID=UPI0022282EC0|nr:hypothetical protein [Entomomonas sp. E2T0]UYZ83134.1 hypothetical protein MTZ49_11045 [Entomomonas sp. E2T0]
MSKKELERKIKEQGGILLNHKRSTHLAVTRNGLFFALVIDNTDVVVWDVLTQKQIFLYKNVECKKKEEFIYSIALTDDGKKLAVYYSVEVDYEGFGFAQAEILIMSTATGDILQTIVCPFFSTNSIAFDETGSFLFVAKEAYQLFFDEKLEQWLKTQQTPWLGNSGLAIWDIETAQLLHWYEAPKGFDVRSMTTAQTTDTVLLTFNAPGNYFSELQDILFYWTTNGPITLTTDLRYCVSSLSPDGEKIYLVGRRNRQCIFQLLDKSGNVLTERNTLEDRSTLLCDSYWHYEGNKIIMFFCGGEVYVIDAKTLEVIETIQCGGLEENFIYFTPHNWTIIAAEYNLLLPTDRMHLLETLMPDEF